MTWEAFRDAHRAIIKTTLDNLHDDRFLAWCVSDVRDRQGCYRGLVADTVVWSARHLPRWNPISISGYHIREAGSTAVQEVAFTLANGLAYAERVRAAGLSADQFGRRLSFFFNAHNHLLEEVAKFRAARRLWARLMKERLGATDPEAMKLRRQTVEHVFGTLKAWMGTSHFLTRTLPRVRTEMSLQVLAYNLKRAIRIIGAGPLMAAMRA